MPRKSPPKLPPGIRHRRGSYFAIYRDPSGRQVEEAAGGDLREAKAYRARRLREVAEGTWQARNERADLTLHAYADRWLPTRRSAIRSGEAEAKWLRKYILPSLGEVLLEELRPKRVAAWIGELGRKDLSAASIRNAHGVLSSMLSSAVFEELILRNVAKGLPRGTLPTIGRSTRPAFSRAEVLVMITDERIEWPRRVTYALAALAGLRLGEVAGRRWGDLESRDGLCALRVASQYHDLPLKGARDEDTAERIVPVHPALDELLEDWRVGWEKHFGRMPRAEDWIVPYGFDALDRPQTNNQVSKSIRRDMKTAEFEVPAGGGMHSFRRWFSSAAQAGGAPREVVRQITHRPKGDVLEDSYTRRSWETLCAAVTAIELQLDAGAEVVPLRVASGALPGGAAGQPAGQAPSQTEKTKSLQGFTGGGVGNRTPVRERSRSASTCISRVLDFAPSRAHERALLDASHPLSHLRGRQHTWRPASSNDA